MKRFVSMIGALLLLCFLLIPLAAQAETAQEEVEVLLTANKEEFTEEEDITASLVIRNHLTYTVTNLQAEILGPEGYVVRNQNALPQGSKLEGGKEFALSLILSKEAVAQEKSQLMNTLLLIGGAILVAGILGMVIYLVIRKKIPQKSVVSMLLVAAMVLGFCAMPVTAQAQSISRGLTSYTLTVSVAGKPLDITVRVSYDNHPNADDLQIDLSGLGYLEELGAFVVDTDFKGLRGTLKNADQYTQIRLELYDIKGNLLQKQSVSPAESWGFSQMGLIPGLNRAIIQVTGPVTHSAELLLYDRTGLFYGSLENADTDSDGDGLYDLLENSIGTDPQNPDTDGDGLTDNQEFCRLGTDPLNSDADGNGIPDGAEDRDGDGISNRQELTLGLSPILPDTDRDGISDQKEYTFYGTDPKKADSDGDGAEDGWELDHGYSPYALNHSFTVSCETGEVCEANPVSASVSVTASGLDADLTSLKIRRLSSADSPYLSEAIAGYMGQAVDITLDGTFQSATLTFRYDTSLGTIGSDFQPRIFHLNETTGQLEELPNQTVYNGTIIAQTSHFSTFIVANAVAYYAAFTAGYSLLSNHLIDTFGLTDDLLAHLGTADIAIVLDRSASMAWNDPMEKQLETARYFLSKMRAGYDNAALLSYTRAVTVHQEPTLYRNELLTALDRFTLDNGVGPTSGTNGAAALEAAISMVEQGAGSYRYVLFFSDGDDASLEARWQELGQRAADQNIQVICVGINTPESTVLADLAAETGGKHVIIRDYTQVSDAFAGVLDIFDTITPSDTDSNNDGISDFVTKMIYDGKIPLQNGSRALFGVDLNLNVHDQPSADWDGDGVINGDELRLVFKNNQAFMQMRSNPCLVDSDLDGFTDDQERNDGTDPMRHTIHQAALDAIVNPDLHYIDEIAQYQEGYLPDGLGYDILLGIRDFAFGMDAFLFAGGSSNREELYWEYMVKYFCENGDVALMEDVERKEVLNFILDVLDTGISNAVTEALSSGAENITVPGKVPAFLKDLHRNRWELTKDPNLSKEDLELKYKTDFADDLEKGFNYLGKKFNLKWNRSEDTPNLFNKLAKRSDKFLPDLEVVETIDKFMGVYKTATEVYQGISTFARINADSEIFLANIEALEYIEKHSQDEFASQAASLILAQLSDSFWDQAGSALIPILREAAQFGIDKAKDALVKYAVANIPVVGTFVAVSLIVLDLVNFVTGIGKEIESTYKLLCYFEIAKAYTYQIATAPALGTMATDANNIHKYYCSIQNLAQVHKVAERHFITHFDIITGIFTIIREDKVRHSVDLHVRRLETAVECIRQGKYYHEPMF